MVGVTTVEATTGVSTNAGEKGRSGEDEWRGDDDDDDDIKAIHVSPACLTVRRLARDAMPDAEMGTLCA